MHSPQPSKDSQTAQIMGLGILFLAIPLILIISRHPDVNSTEFWMCRIIASLGAAAVGGSLPGLVAIDRAGIKATGAVALFVIVFFTTPKGASTSTPTAQPVIQNQPADASTGGSKTGKREDHKPVQSNGLTEHTHRSEFRRLGDDSADEQKTDDARADYEAALCLNEHDQGTREKLEKLSPATGRYVYSLRTVGGVLRDRGKLPCARGSSEKPLPTRPQIRRRRIISSG